MPLYKTSVLYYWDDEAPFDLDYYLDKHMPIAEDVWKSYGLKSWSVTEIHRTEGQPPPQYRVECILEFDTTRETLYAAFEPSVVQVLHKDRPLFSKSKLVPAVFIGNVKGVSKTI